MVSALLHHFRRVRVDQCNKLGFTALMKAAIQGRTKCAKILLFAGLLEDTFFFGALILSHFNFRYIDFTLLISLNGNILTTLQSIQYAYRNGVVADFNGSISPHSHLMSVNIYSPFLKHTSQIHSLMLPLYRGEQEGCISQSL